MATVTTNGKIRTVVGSMRPDGSRGQLRGSEAFDRAVRHAIAWGALTPWAASNFARQTAVPARAMGMTPPRASWLPGPLRSLKVDS